MSPRALAAAFLVAAAAGALHLPSLGHGYPLDDAFVVRDHPVVAAGRFAEALAAPWWPARNGVDLRASNWRPLALLSLTAERAVAPRRVPFLHHLGNVLLHAALVLALLPLARRLAGEGWPAVAALALFAAHPSHAEVVAPVVGRSDLLGALGALVALEAFLRHRETASRAWLAFGAAAFGAGLLGKESALPILALLPCADWLLRGVSPRQLLARRRLAALLPFAAVAALYAAARIAVLGRAALAHGQAESYGFPGRLVFAAHNAGVSASLLALPNRFHHLLTTLPSDAAVTYPLPTGAAAAGWVALALALGTGWIALVRRAPVGAFCWLAALASWLPTSGLLATASGVSMRFLLLPSAFAACGVARGLAAALRARPRAAPLGAAVVVLAVAAEAAITLRRLPAWRDDGTLDASVLAEEPDCYSALYGLAQHLEELPQPDRAQARALLRHAIEVAPPATRGLEARVNLAASYERSGHSAEALALYGEAIAAAPDRFEPYLNRALLLQRIGRAPEARDDLARALERNPSLPGAARLRATLGEPGAGSGSPPPAGATGDGGRPSAER